MEREQQKIELADIIAKKWLAGEKLTLDEKKFLDEWLTSSGEHDLFLKKLENGSFYREYIEIGKLTDQKKQWAKLERLTQPQRNVNLKKWVAYAAGIILLISLGIGVVLRQDVREEPIVTAAIVEPGGPRALLILNDGNQITLQERDTLVNTVHSSINVQMGQVKYEVKDVTDEVEVEYNTIVIPRGGIYSLVLSDGTKVFLNSESELRYPVQFAGNERRVELKGEAFFEVTHDLTRPFVVQTGEMNTRVLGTSFNVLAYADEPVMETTLFSGRVEVSVNGILTKKDLTPGMQACWDPRGGEIVVKEVNLDLQSRWRDGIIMLDDEELESVMRMLSRWYNVTCEFKGDRGIKHTFTGKIDRNEDLGSVLSTLMLLDGPRFEIVGTKVYIY